MERAVVGNRVRRLEGQLRLPQGTPESSPMAGLGPRQEPEKPEHRRRHCPHRCTGCTQGCVGSQNQPSRHNHAVTMKCCGSAAGDVCPTPPCVKPAPTS